jgi:hypothetical protein
LPKLKLVLSRDGMQISIEVPTDAWNESAVVSHHFVAGQKPLGYVRIRLFTPDSGNLTRKAVEALASLGNDGAGTVIPTATSETVRGIRFNRGAGLSPDILATSFGIRESGDAVHHRAVELLTHG